MLTVCVVAALAGCSSTRSVTVDATPVPDTGESTIVEQSTTSVAPTSTSATTTPVSATPAPTTTTAGPRPGVVTITSAASGGGAGEIEVHWNAATGATTYRVYRATSPSGPFTIVATVDVVTGATTVHSGVVNVWGDHQTFWPRPYTSTGTSTSFGYVELDIGGGPHIYYRVVAFNSNGHGPTGATVCAQISMQPAC